MKNRKGLALITTLFFSFFLLFILSGLSTMAVQEARVSSYLGRSFVLRSSLHSGTEELIREVLHGKSPYSRRTIELNDAVLNLQVKTSPYMEFHVDAVKGEVRKTLRCKGEIKHLDNLSLLGEILEVKGNLVLQGEGLVRKSNFSHDKLSTGYFRPFLVDFILFDWQNPHSYHFPIYFNIWGLLRDSKEAELREEKEKFVVKLKGYSGGGSDVLVIKSTREEIWSDNLLLKGSSSGSLLYVSGDVSIPSVLEIDDLLFIIKGNLKISGEVRGKGIIIVMGEVEIEGNLILDGLLAGRLLRLNGFSSLKPKGESSRNWGRYLFPRFIYLWDWRCSL